MSIVVPPAKQFKAIKVFIVKRVKEHSLKKKKKKKSEHAMGKKFFSLDS